VRNENFAEIDSVLVREGSAPPPPIHEIGCVYFVYPFEKIAILRDLHTFSPTHT
jgi:hypothetical protein